MASKSSGRPTKAQAETENFLAMAAKHRAEADYFKEQAAREASLSQLTAMQLAATSRQHEFDMASNSLNRTYDFTGSVGGLSSEMAIQTLSRWARLSREPITIRFSSPGGSVIDGFSLYDSIKAIGDQGIKVTVFALGYAASMAAVLLQSGDTRVAAPNSWLLLHEISSRMGGTVSAQKDDLKFTEALNSRLFDILSERAKISRKKLMARCARKDVWVDSTESLKMGLVDRVGYV